MRKPVLIVLIPFFFPALRTARAQTPANAAEVDLEGRCGQDRARLQPVSAGPAAERRSIEGGGDYRIAQAESDLQYPGGHDPDLFPRHDPFQYADLFRGPQLHRGARRQAGETRRGREGQHRGRGPDRYRQRADPAISSRAGVHQRSARQIGSPACQRRSGEFLSRPSS